jgi:hypothetical protein
MEKIKTYEEFTVTKVRTIETVNAYIEYLKKNGRLNWASKGK